MLRTLVNGEGAACPFVPSDLPPQIEKPRDLGRVTEVFVDETRG